MCRCVDFFTINKLLTDLVREIIDIDLFEKDIKFYKKKKVLENKGNPVTNEKKKLENNIVC